MTPPQEGRLYAVLSLSSTSLSRSRTLERLLKGTPFPSMALNCALSVASGTLENLGMQGGPRVTCKQQLTQPLILFFKQHTCSH